MKTAISIPDDVFEAAEAVARRTGMSRSQLFVEAVKLFLRRHGDRGVTERLDEVYSKAESKVDPALLALQLSATHARDAW
jgi:metal-responsive CopG/Arc/MetJ family transcriptional regulator